MHSCQIRLVHPSIATYVRAASALGANRRLGRPSTCFVQRLWAAGHGVGRFRSSTEAPNCGREGATFSRSSAVDSRALVGLRWSLRAALRSSLTVGGGVCEKR